LWLPLGTTGVGTPVGSQDLAVRVSSEVVTTWTAGVRQSSPEGKGTVLIAFHAGPAGSQYRPR